jgi:tetrahydromethanopterin S-methyltransferase subunit A
MRAERPAAGAPMVSGDTVNVQPDSCVTVKV